MKIIIITINKLRTFLFTHMHHHFVMVDLQIVVFHLLDVIGILIMVVKVPKIYIDLGIPIYITIIIDIGLLIDGLIEDITGQDIEDIHIDGEHMEEV